MCKLRDCRTNCAAYARDHHEHPPATLGFRQCFLNFKQSSFDVVDIVDKLVHIVLQVLNVGRMSGQFTSSGDVGFSHGQHFHALRLLLIRLFGSLAVFSLVSFFFMPSIRAQNESRLLPPSGCGAFNPGFPGFAAL